MTRFQVISKVYEHQTSYSIDSDVWSTCQGWKVLAWDSQLILNDVEGLFFMSRIRSLLPLIGFIFFFNFKKIQILKREVSEERQTSKS